MDPRKFMLWLRSGKALSSVIVPETLNSMLYVCWAEPASAWVIAERSVPGPESASDVTARLKLESTVRSSRRSRPSRSRELGRGRACGGRIRASCGSNREIGDEWGRMGTKRDIGGLSRSGFVYEENKKPYRPDCRAIGPS